MQLERHAQRHVDAYVVDRAVDAVGGEPQTVLLRDVHGRDDEGQLRTRHARLVVDRVRVQRGLPRDRLGRGALRVADRTQGRGRVVVVAAVLAAQEAQLAVLAAGPEAAVEVV